MKTWITNWLSEKTTWLGLFAVGSAFGFDMSEAQQTALAALGASLFIMNDRSK